MTLDSEEQKKLLLQIVQGAQITGNVQGLEAMLKQLVDLLSAIESAAVIISTTEEK